MFAVRWRAVLCVAVVGAVVALLSALVMGSASRADDPSPAPGAAPAAGFQAPPAGPDVASMRTEDSRTYRRGDGRYLAQVSSVPVNFRDAAGAWKPIDTSLEPDGGDGLQTTAAATKVALPGSLADAAKVSNGSRWVAFTLAGADPEVNPTALGSTATYPDVLDGVDAAYTAQASGVKETLTLADASAASTYRFALDASGGLTPSLQADGSVVFRTAAGAVSFSIPAPTVQAHGDAAATTDHVAYHLSDDGQSLRLVVDPAWLASASFPVQVDPTVAYGSPNSCTLTSGSLASTAQCNGSTQKLGHDSSHTYRVATRFEDFEDALPQTASIISANMSMYFTSQSHSSTVEDFTATGLATQLGTGASWNKYDTTHNWTTPGGDLVPETPGGLQSNPLTVRPTFVGGWLGWDIGKLAESWVRDGTTNNGVIVHAVNETTNNVLTLVGDSPTVGIVYEWHPGHESDQIYESATGVDGRSGLTVNPATGNLAVDSHDVHLPGVGGLDLDISRTFNAQDLGDPHTFGSAWTESINGAAFINDRVWWDDARTIYANGGAIYRFDRDYAHDTATTDAFITPPNINADLTDDTTTGIATLTFRDTGIVWSYADSADGERFTLAKISDPAGHHIDLTTNGSGDPYTLASITDTNGTVLPFTYGSNGQLTKISDATHEWKYTTDTTGGRNVLTAYTNPDGLTTTYHYVPGDPNLWDKLDTVTDVTGHQVNLEYGPDGDWSQVTKITQHTGTSTPSVVTNFDYTPSAGVGHACDPPAVDRTVMTDNNARVTTYCYNNNGQVTHTWRPWDTTAPTASAPGAFSGASGEYVSGIGSHTITLGATDAGSGVKRIALTEPGHGDWASATSPCPPLTTLPQLCPASLSETLAVDTSTLTEGVHTVDQASTDRADNVGTSDPWVVRIDRTAPGAATDFAAYYDADNGQADILWSPPADPQLADDTPGSGIGQFSYRYRPTSGVWSDWLDAGLSTSVAVPATGAGDEFDIEVVATDAVGNVGLLGSGHVVAEALPDNSDCEAHDIGGYPASCVTEEQEDEPMDDEADPSEVSLVVPSGLHALIEPVHHTYRIAVQLADGEPSVPSDYRWATIRNAPGKYVTGEAHNGWWLTSDAADDAPPSGGTEPSPYRRGWVTRGIGPDLSPPTDPPHGCGWVSLGNLDDSDVQNDVTADCGTSDSMHLGNTLVTGDPGFSKLNNCPPPDKIPNGPDGSPVAHCTHGTAIYVTKSDGVDVCADVGLDPGGNTHGCTDPLVDEGGDPVHVPKNVCVEWRYVTTDGAYFMAKLRFRDNPTASWVFIPRDASSYSDKTLPNILTKGRAECPEWNGPH